MWRPWLLGLLLALVTAAIAAALVSSETSGTGAENVGESGPERAVQAEPRGDDRERTPRRCKATRSNPGGTNNYIPKAAERDSLGSGFVIPGLVTSCRRSARAPDASA